jgi:RNA polymerase sigma-70 factor (ECF subfamily)
MSGSTLNGTESELIAAILAGDTELYHQLIRPHERSVYVIAFSCLRNREDAEDVAQETFVRAMRNLGAFRGDAKFSTWLIRIALNEARSRLRRQSTAQILSLDVSRAEEMCFSPALLRDWRELPSEAVGRAEIGELLEQAVKTLPDIYQQVFLLRDVSELDVAERELNPRRMLKHSSC